MDNNENVATCNDCGCIIEEGRNSYNYHGDIICEDCFNDNYFICDDCGEVEHYDSHVEIMNNHSIVICEDCARNNFYHCEDCGAYFDFDLGGISTGDGDYICHDCADNYCSCENCGEYYHEGDIEYNDDDDCYYCSHCARNLENNRIYSYHEFRSWEFYKTDNETTPPFYIGFELEVQPKNGETDNQGDAVKCVYDNLNAVCMRDGSLGSGGFEIVSHPQSYNYIMEHKQLLKNTLDSLISWNYTSHDNTQCGLHFHVSRPEQPEVVDRLWHVLETYKKEITLLSRRTGAQLGRWAQFLSDVVLENEKNKLKALYFIKKTDKNYSRYLALNNENKNTIEFRFFKGTLKFETFLAALQFINNLATACNDLNKPIEAITWDVLCDGEYIRPYIEEREIFANFAPIDKSLALIKKENSEKAIISRIIRLYTQYARELLQGCQTKTTNLKNLGDIRKSAREISSYYSALYNNILDDLGYLQNDAEHLYVNDFISRAEHIEHRYTIKNDEIKNKIQENIKKLLKISKEEL